MAGRHTKGPPPIQSKDFTLEDIEHGIRKLRRRIEEVKALDPKTVRYDDARVEAATRNINADIGDIFERNSPEYLAHGSHSLGYSSMVMGKSDYEYQQDFAENLPHTVVMLEGLMKRLEEKREDLAGDKRARVRASFEGLDLHQRISGACADLYRDQHFADAVLRASLALENFVKERSGRYDLSGSTLMEQVFTPNGPALVFNALADQSDKDEQRGMMLLFQGTVFAFRNPRAHKLLEDSPEEALESIALVSLLAKRLEQAKPVKKP